ncbi:MAG: serine/threonine-protein phosphatase [Planctomycetes bacterium]|nr:serine/threonine-protein phosphatase [Planctomycetota bacterium]
MTALPSLRQRQLPQDLLRRIDSDPLFQVTTSDGQQWINPYTGQPVPMSREGRTATARQHLADTGCWRDAAPLPLEQLETERWRLDLMRLMPHEPRLRIFLKDQRGWINPYNGGVVPGIERPDGKVTPRTVWQIAKHLAACPEARTGRMLEMPELLARARAHGAAHAQQETSLYQRQPPESEAARDLAQAQAVQQHMLADLPRPPGYELAVHLSPHAGVAGDFYEASTLSDGRLFLALGDVSGHGMQAALIVATAIKTLRFVARSTADLHELVARFNDEIKPDLVPGQFITLFAAVLDIPSRTLQCVRAGHQPAILMNLAREDVVRRIGIGGMAIGLASGATFRAALRLSTVQLLPGDVLVQCTDGALEAMNEAGVEFGEARYLASILHHYELSAQELVDGIAADVRSHAQGKGVSDDLTVLALTVLPDEDA